MKNYMQLFITIIIGSSLTTALVAQQYDYSTNNPTYNQSNMSSTSSSRNSFYNRKDIDDSAFPYKSNQAPTIRNTNTDDAPTWLDIHEPKHGYNPRQ